MYLNVLLLGSSDHKPFYLIGRLTQVDNPMNYLVCKV